ncbi:MAG: hypothetical protein R3304_11440, partial [Longimicrobiales bacterium]|nr:hypothetical protein [Longimicrobiales bacterium]
MSDTHTVRAFLEADHHPWGAAVAAFAARELEPRPEPEDDVAARVAARELLAIMGDEGLFRPIGVRDLRGCCLAREVIAAASPLADAVWA